MLASKQCFARSLGGPTGLPRRAHAAHARSTLVRTPLATVAEFGATPTLPATTAPHPFLVAALHCAHGDRAPHVLGVDADTFGRWVTSDPVLDAIAVLESAVRKRVIDASDADAVTIAKVAAPASMRKLLALGRDTNGKVAVAALKVTLDAAGVVAQKAPARMAPHDLIDAMTAEELERFLGTGQWPARFGDHLRQLALRRQLAHHGRLDAIDAEFEEVPPTNGTPP